MLPDDGPKKRTMPSAAIENEGGQLKLHYMSSPVLRDNGFEVYGGDGVGATGAMRPWFYKRIGKCLFLHIIYPVKANSGSLNYARATLPSGMTLASAMAMAFDLGPVNEVL